MAGGLLFVEPVYIERANQESSYPQLARVLVFYNDQVGLQREPVRGAGPGVRSRRGGRRDADTRRWRGRSGHLRPGEPRRAGSPELAAATAELQSALGQVRTAQQSGDLGSLGQALQALDTAVKNFQSANGQAASAPAPVPVPGPGG